MFCCMTQPVQLCSEVQRFTAHNSLAFSNLACAVSAPPLSLLLSVLLLPCCLSTGTAIGNAYGIAVNMVMLGSIVLVSIVMLVVWGKSPLLVAAYCLPFAVIVGAFLSANLLNVAKGGWFSLAVATCLAAISCLYICGTSEKAKALHRCVRYTVTCCWRACCTRLASGISMGRVGPHLLHFTCLHTRHCACDASLTILLCRHSFTHTYIHTPHRLHVAAHLFPPRVDFRLSDVMTYKRADGYADATLASEAGPSLSAPSPQLYRYARQRA